MSGLCSYFDTQGCSSCSLLSESLTSLGQRYQQELQRRSQELESEPDLAPSFLPTQVFPSRVKAKFSVGGTVDKPIIGLTDQALHVSELESCPLHFPLLNEAATFVRTLIPKLHIPPYNIQKQRGELKGLIALTNSDQSGLSLRFVLRSDRDRERIKQAVPKLQERFPNLRAVTVNIQPVPHQILEGEDERVLYGGGWLWEQYSGFELAFAPRSFVQVTYETASELYRLAGEYFRGLKPKGVIDLYCGAGGFAFAASPYASWVIGVEHSEAALEPVRASMERNGFRNLDIYASTAESFLREYVGEAPDIMVLNPPRRGVELGVLEACCRLAPEALLYSSCNAETLFRDLRILETQYSVMQLRALTMFPFTAHFETLAFLVRK